jgi:hypothetical protein
VTVRSDDVVEPRYRKAVRRGVLLQGIIIGSFVIVTGTCVATIHGWTGSDTYSAASGLALFMLGLFIVRRQDKLQSALADLEIEEKITVLLAHAAALLDDDKSYVGFNVVGDAVACMSVLDFATRETRSHYSQAACAALDQLAKAVRDRSPFTPEELDRLVTTTGRIIDLVGRSAPGVQREIDNVKQAAKRLLVDLHREGRGTTSNLAGTPIPIASFTAVLGDHVRVALDFSRLNETDFRARARVINNPSGLVGWVSPWYVDADGDECDYSDEGAMPSPIVDSGGVVLPAPPSHAETIASIARSMSDGRPGPILIGCYQPFGREVVVVVDGNHRLRALLSNGGPLHVVALILHGPDDPTVLSDLGALGPV